MIIKPMKSNPKERGVVCMSKRGENIRKRKDGRWEGRYKKGRDANGKIIYGSVYGKKYREVKEKLALIIQTDGTPINRKNGERQFREVLMLWLETNRIRHKGATESKYLYLIETHIVPELGSIRLSQINATIINSFLMKKLENGRLDQSGGLSSSYVRSIMLIINATLKFAADEQMCQPLKTPIYKPTSCKKELPILNLETQVQIESFLTQKLDPTKAGIFISLHTGLRIGEICALSWEDIDFERKIIHVRHTVARVSDKVASASNATKLIIDTPKTKASTRDIPISSRLFPIINELKNISNSKYLVSYTAGFVSPRTYEYRYHKVLDECGVSSVNYHALRHTFATRCIEAGVDVKSLSEILGHGNVSVTLNTYVHSSMELKRTQIEKLANMSTENGQKSGIQN